MWYLSLTAKRYRVLGRLGRKVPEGAGEDVTGQVGCARCNSVQPEFQLHFFDPAC